MEGIMLILCRKCTFSAFEISPLKCTVGPYLAYYFRALTLLDRRQEAQSACKNVRQIMSAFTFERN